jgi:hypothetical protein
VGFIDDLSKLDHGTLRLLDADSGLEPGHERPIVQPALAEKLCALAVHGNPEIRRTAQALESGRHYAHHGVRFPVEMDRATDDGGIGSEPPLPQAVTQ